MERLTEDHSLVEELVRQGKITPAEAEEHPQRSIITRALGPESAVEPDSHTWPARDGDVYLICSDGLTSMVPEQQVGELVRSATSLGDAGRKLVDAANAAGGRDNITVVLFSLEDVGAPATSAPTSEHPVVADAVPAGDGGATAVAAPPQAAPAETTATHRREPASREPRAPGGRARRRRRRRLRVPVGLIVTVFFLGIIGLSGWYASQTVYFVGAGDDGFVTVFRGLPYELPAGLDLYSVNYVSGVPMSELTPSQRRTVTEHKLRPRDDAHDLVRRLETGELAR